MLNPKSLSGFALAGSGVTVILSKRGWVRAAKGHEVEAEKNVIADLRKLCHPAPVLF